MDYDFPTKLTKSEINAGLCFFELKGVTSLTDFIDLVYLNMAGGNLKLCGIYLNEDNSVSVDLYTLKEFKVYIRERNEFVQWFNPAGEPKHSALLIRFITWSHPRMTVDDIKATQRFLYGICSNMQYFKDRAIKKVTVDKNINRFLGIC